MSENEEPTTPSPDSGPAGTPAVVASEAQPPDAAPKKRGGAKAALVAVLVVVLLAGLGTGGYFGYRSWRTKQDAAAFARAEAHYAAATKLLLPLNDFSGTREGDPVPRYVKLADALAKARADYDAAQADIAALPASPAKTEYQSSLKKAVASLDAFDKLMSTKPFGPMADDIQAMLDVTQKAFDTQEASTQQNNAGKMDQAAKTNKQALALYTEAEARLAALDAAGRTTWLKELRDWVAAQRHSTQLGQSMFDEFKSRDRTNYDKAVDAYNALLPTINSLEEPSLAYDPQLVYASFWDPYDAASSTLDTSAVSHEKAVTLWETALKAAAGK
jgi:hypothetical protein